VQNPGAVSKILANKVPLAQVQNPGAVSKILANKVPLAQVQNPGAVSKILASKVPLAQVQNPGAVSKILASKVPLAQVQNPGGFSKVPGNKVDGSTLLALMTACDGKKVDPSTLLALMTACGGTTVHPPKVPLLLNVVEQSDPPEAPVTAFYGAKYVQPPKAPAPYSMVRAARDLPPGDLRAKLALVKEEQEKGLREILEGLENLAKSMATGLGLDADPLQAALDAAKDGDFTALDSLINDQTKYLPMKNILAAYQITAKGLADLRKGGLDDQTLNKLEDTLKALPSNAVTDSFRNELADVKKWNEIGKKLDSVAQDPGSQGPKGPAMAAEIRSVVNQALAAAGYGSASGLLPSNAVVPADGDAGGSGVAAGSYAEPPVPAAPAAAATIVLSNPAENRVTMPFLLNSQTAELQAGQYVELPTDRAWELKFDRGEGFGVACYSLTDGLYKFTHTRQGWELVQEESAAQ
jgi:hypothetical protein